MTPGMVEGGLKSRKITSCAGGGGVSAAVCVDGSIWTWGYVNFLYIYSALIIPQSLQFNLKYALSPSSVVGQEEDWALDCLQDQQ